MNRRQRFSFLRCEIRYSPLEFNSQKIPTFDNGITAMKFETAQIHFLGDIFAAIAVLLLVKVLNIIHFR